jgi:hypothetical protein
VGMLRGIAPQPPLFVGGGGGFTAATPHKLPRVRRGFAAKKEEKNQVWDCPPKAMKPLR